MLKNEFSNVSFYSVGYSYDLSIFDTVICFSGFFIGFS